MMAVVMLMAVAVARGAAPGEPIRSGCEVDYPPFSIVHEDGRADGFSVELLRAALSKMGREVTFRTGQWDEVRGWLERGEIDALPLVGRTPEREALFDFTVPYMTMHGVIVVRTDTTDVNTLEDLSGRQVGVMKGDNAEEFLRREDRGFEIVSMPTFTEALHALDQGRCDAVVVQRLVVIRLLRENGLDRLRIIDRPIPDFAQAFCFAVKAGDHETLAMLNEGLALAVADGTHRHLHAKWFAALELPSDRPIVIGGDHNYPPFEFLDEAGQPAGYNVDIVRAIAEATGLDIRIRLGEWTSTMKALERGEIDAIQGMLYSQERDETFDFSQAHLVNHCVAVVRTEDGPPPSVLAELSGKRIVVQNGDIMHEYCIQNGLTNQLEIVDSQEQALQELAAGKHDCALVARMAAFYWIEREGWTRLAVGRTSLVSPEYSFAVPRGQQRALLAQLSEGLTAIAHSGEYKRIQEKWMGVYGDHAHWRNMLKYVAWVSLPLLLIAFLALFLSWGLRKQVARRTSELQEKEALLSRSQEIAHIGSWKLDLTSRHLTWSDEVYRIFGCKPQAFAPTYEAFLDFAHPEDRSAVDEAYFRSVREGTVGYEIEHRIVRRNSDEVRYVHERCVHERDAAGTIVQSAGMVQDITERKLAEKELRRLSTAIEQSPETVVITDTVGTIQYVNPAFKTTTGYTCEEAMGQNPRILKSGRQDAGFYKAMWNTLLEGRVWQGRMVNKRKDGSIYTEEASIAPVKDPNGTITNYVGVKRDITAELKLEEQLHQAQKMESVGRLAGGVAHDFNNLLMGIMGYAELCRDALPENHPVREWIDEITCEAQRSANLTRQLLAFARKQTIAPQVLDLNDAVGNMLKMLRRLIGEDIDLVWQPGVALESVKMDPGQLDQILANLCVNARDAIGGAGKLTIETDNVTIDADYCAEHIEAVPGSYVMLAVSDDGCGMDRETLKNIFEPFFTTKPTGEGTGLGLSTVYGIVKQNHGFINVYSDPGNGSTFRIYLPRDTGVSNVAQETATETGSQGGTETILLVEDETAIRTIMCLFLGKLGYNVIPAENPAEALRLAKAHRDGIDLMITDVVMPGMNGRDLAEKLAPDFPSMKILYMSGYTANVIAHRGILEEGVQFMSKPVGRDALAQKVREVLG